MTSLIRSASPLALIAALLLLAPGCSTRSSDCEALCKRFVNDCQFSAWSSVPQCTQGCVDDLYRRNDADDVLACYHAAVDAPTAAAAEEAVDNALSSGFFDAAVADGTFERDAAIQQAIVQGTCDPFAVVQCKIEAVQVPPSTPLVR